MEMCWNTRLFCCLPISNSRFAALR